MGNNNNNNFNNNVFQRDTDLMVKQNLTPLNSGGQQQKPVGVEGENGKIHTTKADFDSIRRVVLLNSLNEGAENQSSPLRNESTNFNFISDVKSQNKKKENSYHNLQNYDLTQENNNSQTSIVPDCNLNAITTVAKAKIAPAINYPSLDTATTTLTGADVLVIPSKSSSYNKKSNVDDDLSGRGASRRVLIDYTAAAIKVISSTTGGDLTPASGCANNESSRRKMRKSLLLQHQQQLSGSQRRSSAAIQSPSSSSFNNDSAILSRSEGPKPASLQTKSAEKGEKLLEDLIMDTLSIPRVSANPQRGIRLRRLVKLGYSLNEILEKIGADTDENRSENLRFSAYDDLRSPVLTVLDVDGGGAELDKSRNSNFYNNDQQQRQHQQQETAEISTFPSGRYKQDEYIRRNSMTEDANQSSPSQFSPQVVLHQISNENFNRQNDSRNLLPTESGKKVYTSHRDVDEGRNDFREVTVNSLLPEKSLRQTSAGAFSKSSSSGNSLRITPIVTLTIEPKITRISLADSQSVSDGLAGDDIFDWE
eukprot:GDKJ01055648.1.p1 GENE.GDKJ01055648.1~~GDKJ01055648.1.p1  ORF type:complete len:536 (-),score=143.00 GDKJ01055648.1:54-1661(-)